MSQSWTTWLKVRHSGSLIVLTKHERACRQSCYRRLGSDRVWSMSQDQTVCLEVGQPVSKLDDLLTSIFDKRWESLHAILLRASWQWSCVEYVSRSDSMSRSWTALSQSQTFWLTDCLDKTCVSLHAILLRASCQWSCVKYSSDQTVCLKVGQPVSKLDDLLIGVLDKRWESMHAILLRASWEWSWLPAVPGEEVCEYRRSVRLLFMKQSASIHIKITAELSVSMGVLQHAVATACCNNMITSWWSHRSHHIGT